MELYYFKPSPPCRAVLLFVKALNLHPTLRELDITKGENLTPEYTKLNPQHTIPLVVDDGFVLSESRAILVYLAEQYGQKSSFYPNDAKARGVINQRLMFDLGTLYPRFLDTYRKFFTSTGSETLDVSKMRKLTEAIEYLNSFIGDSLWMAGDEITIADFSLIASVSTIEACGFDLSEFDKVKNWLERCKKEITDYHELNEKGAHFLGAMVRKNLENS